MSTIYLSLLLLAIYTLYYAVVVVHKPTVYSKNKGISKIASTLLCPMFLLPFGIINSMYQIIRNVGIPRNSTRNKMLLEVEKGVHILVEVIEPGGRISAKKRSKTFSLISGFLEFPSRQIFLIINISAAMSRTILKLTVHIFDAISGRKLRGLTRRLGRLGARQPLAASYSKEPVWGDSSPVRDSVLLVHGLNGTSNSTYIKGMANVFLERNVRVFCFNARGALHPPTSNFFNHIGFISDIEKVIDFILSNYSGMLSLVGFSMGANWIASYLGKYPQNNRINIGVGVCCPFDFKSLRSHFTNGFYARAMNLLLAMNYKKYLNRSMKTPVKLNHCKFVEEIDMEFLETIFASDSLDDFYSKSSCIHVLDSISVPTLFVSASDDPLIPKEIIPVLKHESNPNLSFFILRGGHLGFFANGAKTNAEILVGQYYDTISNRKSAGGVESPCYRKGD